MFMAHLHRWALAFLGFWVRRSPRLGHVSAAKCDDPTSRRFPSVGYSQTSPTAYPGRSLDVLVSLKILRRMSKNSFPGADQRTEFRSNQHSCPQHDNACCHVDESRY